MINEGGAVSQSAEWPRYNFSKLISEKTDLVVLAEVSLIENVKDKVNENKQVQFSTLDVQEKYFGKESNSKIMLYQSVDKVKKNKRYLLFLEKVEGKDFYVVSDGNSQIEVKNNMVQIKIPQFEGEYTLDQFKAAFRTKLNELNLLN